MNSEQQTKQTEETKKANLIRTLGVRPAVNRRNAIARAVAALAVAIFVVWSIIDQRRDDAEEEENLEYDKATLEMLRPNCKLIKLINDIDNPIAKKRVMNKVEDIVLDRSDSMMKKYIKSIKTALLAGIMSEYIINGSSAKPIGIIGKTVVYNLIYTLATA